MNSIPPKFTESKLQYILFEETVIPHQISEGFIESELINNPRLKWILNPFLLNGNLLKLFTDTKAYRQWLLLKGLNWIALGLISVFSILTQDYKLLFMIPVYIAFITSGFLSFWIFISATVIAFLFGYVGKIENHYFWFSCLVAQVAYLVSKLANKVIEHILLKKATSNSKTFWKFFSNKLIDLDSDTSYAELLRLEELNPVIRRE